MDSGPSTASSSTTFFAERKHVLRYLGVGAAAAAVDIGLFWIFARELGLPYLRVAIATFVAATLVNYVLSVRFVFVSGVRFRRRWELALVFLVSGLGLAVNNAMLWICVERLALDLLLAKIAATGTVFFWNYFARRQFVFAGTRD
jgi:putative flippase GtrA